MKKILQKINTHTLTFIFLNIYIFMLIFLPPKYASVFGLPIRLIFTIIMIFIIFYDKWKGKIQFIEKKSRIIIIFMILFSICTIPSIIVSKSIVTSIYTLIKYLSIFTLLTLICKIKFTKEEYNIIIKNVIISAFVLCSVGIIQYITGKNIMIKNAGVEYYPGAKGRIYITFFNTIYYGIFINLIFALVFYILNKTNNKKNVVVLSILCILLYINLILTFTRSAIIIFIAILALMIILLNKLIFNEKSLIILLSLIIVTFSVPGAKTLVKKSFVDVYSMASNILSFLPGVNIDDYNYVDYDEDSDFIDYSLQHREAFATMAKEIANDNLLTGVGFGAYIDYMQSKDFDIKYPEYKLPKTHPHSSVILMFAELGVFGLISFCLILIGLLIKAFLLVVKYFKRDQLYYEISSILFIITSGFVVVNIMSENAIYDTQISYMFVIIFGLLISYISLNNNSKKDVIFISSTGGHLNELMQLKPLMKKYNSYIITEKTKSNLSLKNKFENVYYLTYGTKKNLFKYFFVFSFNILKSFYYFFRIRPSVVVTTGTHTAVPMCYIAKLFGSKVIFIETFANSKTKTVAGKLVYPIADTFIVQWESMLELYPKAILGGWIY